MTWIINNIGTIAVFIVLAAAVVLIIQKMKKDKASGKHSCGAGCANCALCDKCGKR